MILLFQSPYSIIHSGVFIRQIGNHLMTKTNFLKSVNNMKEVFYYIWCEFHILWHNSFQSQ